MTERYRNTGDLLPGLVMPQGWPEHFRKLLARIENADTPVNCLLAQERAEGVVEGLELADARDAETLERLYLLIAGAASVRLQQIGSDGGEG